MFKRLCFLLQRETCFKSTSRYPLFQGRGHIFQSKYSTTTTTEKIPCSKKISGSTYFMRTNSGNIKLIQENIKNETDLKESYEEYVSLIQKQEKLEKLKCKSCGIHPLQSKNPEKHRYFKIPKISLHIQKKKEGLTQIHKEAEIELLKEMGFDKESTQTPLADVKDILIEQKAKELGEIANYNVECSTCQQVKYHGDVVIAETQIEEILKTIPSNGTIVNVISLLDFPLSCTKDIIRKRDPKSIWYVVTKADLFFRRDSQLNKTGLQYAQDFLCEYLNADPKKVFLVSTTKSWNNDQLLERLPKGNLYLIGFANVGKSSLIKSLIASVNNIDMTSKVFQKIENKNKNYLEKVGLNSPGVYHLPGFTKELQKFKINDRITIFDTPGILPDTGVYKYITQELLRRKPRYPSFIPEDLKRYVKTHIKGPKIYSGESLYSYGGFFYLQPPKNAIFKRCMAFKFKETTFEVRYKNMNRAKEINKTRPKQIGNRYGVNEDAFSSLKRYVIPPFYGTIDIVVQGIGFLSIKPTSSPDAVDGLFQIWVPEGVHVIVRESIFNFLYKTHDIVDETGNKLRKENIARRGATRQRRISDEDKLHFTELFEVPVKEKSELAFASVCPPEDMKIGDAATAQENYKNQYWKKLNL